MQGWWKNIWITWILHVCLKTGCDILLTTTDANADSSPFEFIAETRYCAVSSKSQLKEERVTWTMSIIHILSLLRGPVFCSPPPPQPWPPSTMLMIPRESFEVFHNSWPGILWEKIDTAGDVIENQLVLVSSQFLQCGWNSCVWTS